MFTWGQDTCEAEAQNCEYLYLLHVVQTVNCCCPRTPGVTGVTGAGWAHWPVVTSGHPPQPADQWRQTLRGWPAACHRKLARESLCLQI